VFVYNFYRKQDYLAYQVVSYWVEDYNGPHTMGNPFSDTLFGNPTLADVAFKISVATGINTEVAFIAFVASCIIGIVTIAFVIMRLRNKKRKRRKFSKNQRK